MEVQRETGGSLPEKDGESERRVDVIRDASDEECEKEWVGCVPDHLKHQSMVFPLAFCTRMFEAVANLVVSSVPVSFVQIFKLHSISSHRQLHSHS